MIFKRRYRLMEGEGGAGEGGAGGAGGAPAADDWRTGLPEEMRSHASLEGVENVEALTKRFLDGQSMISQSIRMPGPDASAEDLKSFRDRLLDKNMGLMAVPNTEDEDAMASVYKAMGLPEDIKGYTRPENWNGMTDERFGFLAGEALKAGVSKSQFEQMVKSMSEADNAVSQQYTDEHKAGMDELKGEWGRAFDQKLGRAGVIAKQLEAPPALLEAIESGNVDASTLRWMDKIAEKFGGEGSALVNVQGDGMSEHTPSEVNTRIAEITKKMLDMDSSDPAYQGLLKKRIEYAEMLKAG